MLRYYAENPTDGALEERGEIHLADAAFPSEPQCRAEMLTIETTSGTPSTSQPALSRRYLLKAASDLGAG